MNLSKAAVVGLFSSVLLLGSNSCSNFVGAESVPADVADNIDIPLALAEAQERSTRIIGGEDAAAGEYPWYTFVKTAASSGCGGQLISPSIVLTAAHCVVFEDGTTKPADDTRNKVWIGAYEKKDGGGFDVPSFGIKRILPHPNFNPSTYNFDFALLFLDGQVTTTQPVQLDLTGISNTLKAGDDIFAIGFGDTDPRPGDDDEFITIPTVLQEVTMKYINKEDCESFTRSTITDVMLCAGDGKVDDTGGAKGTCQRDSGGSFFIERNGEPVVVGVVSFTPTTCTDFVSVSARVSEVARWIRQEVNDLSTLSTPAPALTKSESPGKGKGKGGKGFKKKKAKKKKSKKKKSKKSKGSKKKKEEGKKKCEIPADAKNVDVKFNVKSKGNPTKEDLNKILCNVVEKKGDRRRLQDISPGKILRDVFGIVLSKLTPPKKNCKSECFSEAEGKLYFKKTLNETVFSTDEKKLLIVTEYAKKKFDQVKFEIAESKEPGKKPGKEEDNSSFSATNLLSRGEDTAAYAKSPVNWECFALVVIAIIGFVGAALFVIRRRNEQNKP